MDHNFRGRSDERRKEEEEEEEKGGGGGGRALGKNRTSSRHRHPSNLLNQLVLLIIPI